MTPTFPLRDALRAAAASPSIEGLPLGQACEAFAPIKETMRSRTDSTPTEYRELVKIMHDGVLSRLPAH